MSTATDAHQAAPPISQPYQPEIGLRKKAKNHLTAEHIVKMEPPDFSVDDDGQPRCELNYGTVDFKPKTAPCSQAVWRRAEGRSGDGVVRDGLTTKSGRCDFILYREKGKDEVVAIDTVPKEFYQGKRNAPAKIHDLESGEFLINPTTGEITVEPDKLPVGFTKRQLHIVIRELNKSTLVQTGQMLGGAFEVTDVRGNRVFIALPRQGFSAGGPVGVNTYGG